MNEPNEPDYKNYFGCCPECDPSVEHNFHGIYIFPSVLFSGHVDVWFLCKEHKTIWLYGDISNDESLKVDDWAKFKDFKHVQPL
jgi:hypothetical protein